MGKELFEGRSLLKYFFKDYLVKFFDDGKETRSFLPFRNKQREQEPYCPKIFLFSGENGLGKSSALKACIELAKETADDQKKMITEVAIDWDSWYLKKGFIPLTVRELIDSLYEIFAEKHSGISGYFSSYQNLSDKLKNTSLLIEDLKTDEWHKESQDILPENESEEMKLWLQKKLKKQDLESLEKSDFQLTEILIQGLKNSSSESPVILSIDNYDYLTPELDEWFRTVFLSQICNEDSKIITIISGNSNLIRGFRNVFPEELLYTVNFADITLTINNIAHLAKKANITLPESQIRQIEEYSAGIPVVVRDIFNYLKQGKNLNDIIDNTVSYVWNIQELVEAILSRFLSLTEDNAVKEKIFHFAMLKKNNPGVLQELWYVKSSELKKIQKDLAKKFAFIETDHIHILLRNSIRSYLIHELSTGSESSLKQLFDSYSKVCSRFFKDQLKQLNQSVKSFDKHYQDDNYRSAAENYLFSLIWGSPQDALSFLLGLYVELIYFNPEFASSLLWEFEEFREVLSPNQIEVIEMLNSGLISSDRSLFRKRTAVQQQEQDIFSYLDKCTSLMNDFQKGLLQLKLGEIKYRNGDSIAAMEYFSESQTLLGTTLPQSSLLYESFVLLGYEFEKSGDYNRAVEAFDKAISIKPQRFWPWLDLGLSHLQLKDYEKAINSLSQAVNINPDHQDAWYNLGLSYAAVSKHQDAVEAFKHALEKGPETQILWFQMGNSLEKTEKFDEAANAYKKVVSINPDHVEAWYLLGKCYSVQKQSSEAIEAYKNAIAIKPDYLMVLKAMGSEYYVQKMYSEAAETFQKAVQLDEENEWFWNQVAKSWLGAEKFQKAIDACAKAIALNKNSSESWVITGNAHTALGNFSDALSAYQNASVIDPDNPLIWNHIGNTYYSQSNFDEAISAFRKAVAIDPSTEGAYFNIGLASKVKKNYEDAIEAFGKAVEFNPGSAECWFQKGRVHMIVEQYQDAIQCFSETIKITPDSHDAWYRKGLACAKIGIHHDAIEAFVKAAELWSSDPDIWCNLGLSYCAESLFNEAVQAFTNASKLNETRPEIWLNLGNAYKELNQFESAINAFQKTCELKHDSSEAWKGLGMCQYFIEKYSEAKQSLQKALELEPDNTDILYHLALTCHALQQYEEAINFYQHITELKPDHQDAWYNMALAFHGSENFLKAIDVYKLTVSRWPENSSAWNNLGIAYHATGKLEKAVKAYHEASRIAPQRSDIWYNLGIAYHTMEHYGEAIQAYRKVVRLSADNYDAWYNLGLSYYVWGHYDDAIESYIKASQLKPDNHMVWGNLAIAYFDTGDYDKTIETSLKALKLNNNETWLISYQILSSLLTAKVSKAKEFADKLLAVENASSEIPVAISMLQKYKNKNAALEGFDELIHKLESSLNNNNNNNDSNSKEETKEEEEEEIMEPEEEQ